MEDQGITSPNPDEIRLLLEKQEENLQLLHAIISGMKGVHIDELQLTLTEHLNSIKEVERQMWKIFFPHSGDEYAAEHRMTMQHQPNTAASGN